MKKIIFIALLGFFSTFNASAQNYYGNGYANPYSNAYGYNPYANPNPISTPYNSVNYTTQINSNTHFNTGCNNIYSITIS